MVLDKSTSRTNDPYGNSIISYTKIIIANKAPLKGHNMKIAQNGVNNNALDYSSNVSKLMYPKDEN